jgi:hypothetical protein
MTAIAILAIVSCVVYLAMSWLEAAVRVALNNVWTRERHEAA